MLFLMRSAVCIGLVVSALPDRPSLTASAGDAVGSAAFAGLCRIDGARCRAVAGTLLTVDPGETAPRGRKLRSQPAAEAAPLSRQAEVL